MTNAWMVRSGGSGFLIDEFIEKSVVAIGWNELGEIPKGIEYGALKKKFIEIYPDTEGGSANQSCGQIWRFVNDIQKGDMVVTYDPGPRLYYIGEVQSEEYFDDKLTYQHARKILWQSTPIERDNFTVESKNTLGSVLTVFSLNENVAKEIALCLKDSHPSVEEIKEMTQKFEAAELERLKSDVASRAKEFIQDLIANLNWQDTERLVAGLLNAMGYKTRFTSRGSDLGSDILASPDGLGLQEPRIKVEVKKRSSEKIGAPDIRSFIGGLRTTEKGIYVTTTGFSKEARYEAERANFAITLVDSEMLVDLLLEHYEKMSAETKALVPLKKIYWPV